jgi:hypothetical protein
MKRIVMVLMATVLLGAAAGAAMAGDDALEAPQTEDTSTSTSLSDAQTWKAEVIADSFVADDAEEGEAQALTEEIVAARTGEPSVGWGALYKVMQLWVATGEDGEDLTTFMSNLRDEGGWAFGKRFKELEPDQQEKLDAADLPKNLGQAQKQAKAEERALKKANKNNEDD